MRKAVFLDKDGTLIKDIPYNINTNLITLDDYALPALKKLKDSGYLLIVVTNQSGIARGYFEENAIAAVKQKLDCLLEQGFIHLDGFYYCPHYIHGIVAKYAIACNCRKPKPGMILRAAKHHRIVLSESWFIGNSVCDIEAGQMAGCKTILVDKNACINDGIVSSSFVASNLYEAALHISSGYH